MSSTIGTVVHTVWTWLPEATVVLQFATALIGLILAADSAVQRLHRSRRHRR